MSRTTRAGLAVAAVTTVVMASMGTASAAVPTDTSALRDAVTSDAIMDHLAELQKIADNNDGIRASGTPGYGASVDYIANLLEDAGYEVSRQPFLFNSFRELSDPVFQQVSPNAVTYVPNEDFFTAEYSGSGDVTATLQAVDLVLPPGATAGTSNSGCEPEDFATFTDGNIALVQRGTCDFSVKAHNAFEAGAVER